MVSAWATSNGLSLGQINVNGKSNEITAIPEQIKLLEPRGCVVTIDAVGCQWEIAGLGSLERWPHLAAMAMCRATRTVKGETSTEERFFITSNAHGNVEKIATALCAHRQVEDCLHRVLDVAFDADQCRIRVGYAAGNLATIRRLALNALKADKTAKVGAKTKRKGVDWDTDYL